MSVLQVARRAALVGALCTLSGAAWGQESVYCRKVQARASADAALLVWPKLIGEALRFPALNEVAGPTILETGIQVRLGLTISPTDMVQGLRLDDLANAECELHEVGESLRLLLAEGVDAATQGALQEQVTFLLAHRDEWKKLVSRAEERRRAGVITIIELEGLRRLANGLERKLATAQGEAERLGQKRWRRRAPGTFGDLSRRYVDSAMRIEQQGAGNRMLDAFHVGLTGGIIPGFGRPSEWFGVVQVSYQLGGVISIPATDRYLAARREELERADYELPAELSDAWTERDGQLAKARRELEVVEGELATTGVTATALASATATLADQARDTVLLEQLTLKSERVLLTTLIDRLGRVRE